MNVMAWEAVGLCIRSDEMRSNLKLDRLHFVRTALTHYCTLPYTKEMHPWPYGERLEDV